MYQNETLSVNQYVTLSDGIQLRYKVWRSPKPVVPQQSQLPRIIILLGRGSVIEEVEHFILKIVEQNIEVWCFDWRGQGLSTRNLGLKGYVSSYSMYIDDLHQFIKTTMMADGSNQPIIIIGHSMGSHIALRYCAEYPGVISAALLTAPMLDIYKGCMPRKLVFYFFKFLCHVGFEKRYFRLRDNHNVALQSFRDNDLTRNQNFFQEMRQLMVNHPELSLGGVTFGWLRATLESINVLLESKYLAKINIPIHMVEAGDDHIVNNINLNRICNKMDHCSFEVIPHAKHELLSELPAVQDRIIVILNQIIESLFRVIPNVSYRARENMLTENTLTNFWYLLKKFVTNKKTS